MSQPEKYYQELQELFSLYKVVKEIVLLAEYSNDNRSYIVSSVNELRNAFDHVMKSLQNDINFKEEFKKAKGHLYRAGFDAYEIIALNRLAEIEKIKSSYSYTAIIGGYPDYQKKLTPLVKRTKKKLAEVRGNKLVIVVEDEKSYFEDYEKIVTELMEACDDLNLHVDGINEAYQAELKKSGATKNWILGVLSALFISVATGVIVLMVEYGYFQPKVENDKNIISIPKQPTQQIKIENKKATALP